MQSLIVLASLASQLTGGVKISSCPSPKIRASLEKNYIFGILVERAINYVNLI